jgi:hypothetical protein
VGVAAAERNDAGLDDAIARANAVLVKARSPGRAAFVAALPMPG